MAFQEAPDSNLQTTDRQLNGSRASGNGALGNGAVATTPRSNGSSVALEAPATDLALKRTVAPVTRPRARIPIARDAVFRRLLAVADLAAAAGGLATLGLLSGHGTEIPSLLSLPTIVLIAKMSGRYDHDELVLRKSTLDEMPRLLGLAGAFALTWSLIAFIANVHPNLGGGGVIVLWGTTAFLLVGLRLAARVFGQLWAPRERVLIVGGAAARLQLAQSLASDPGARIEIAGFLPLEDERRTHSDWGARSRRKRQVTFDDMAEVVRELDIHRVFLIPTSADSETMLDAVSRTTVLGVKVSIVPRLFEVVGSAVEFDEIGGVTVLGVRRPGLSRSSRAVKRLTDVVGSLAGLILLAPFGALVAIAIALDTTGPVFFRQRRVGRDGRTFEMIKFRSMIDGAERQRAALQTFNETDGLFKLSTDPRVTRVGRLLRRTSIDELPQLINVLLGDMSLVGPRPLVVDEDRLVEGRHRERLALLPGMTGPWQVLGPTRPPLSEMVKTDYLYAANWSLWTDVKILLRTFTHVAGQRGL